MTTAVPLDGVAILRRISAEVCEEVFRPPPRLTVSQCADRHRVLPRTSAEPGQWRTDRVPYLRGIMDALGDERIREVLFVKSAQVGGTSCGENYLLFLMLYAACGILMLWPTEKKLRSWSRKKLTPLIEENAELAARIPTNRRRDSANTIAAKEFPGGFLQMLTAKSTSDLRSTDARVGIIEELDEVDAEIKDQGDPIEQFDARFRTFWNAKVYKVSTPTVEGGSRTWNEWERSTQHRYLVPCPHCGHRQMLKWRDGKDDQDEAGSYRLIWDEDENGEVVPGSTKYLCDSVDAGGCGALIEEHHKMAMLLAGEWAPEHPGRYVTGFHINTLYSPLCSWDDVARAFLKAKRSPATMQTFVNLWLGLPYREPGSQVDAHFLSQRAEPYGGESFDVPHGVALLTVGIDVQGDRLVVAVWGWGAGEESWLIAYEELQGDPGRDEVWEALEKGILLAPWRHESGAPMRIAAACIDANYQTERVHRFAMPRFARNVVAVIGRDGRGRKLIDPPRPDRYKRTARERHPAHVVGTDTAKDSLMSRLRLTRRPDDSCPPGFVHFPEAVDPIFYDQLTAERLVTVYRAARPIRMWKLIEGRRNEALDCTVYAMAALRFLTMGRAPKLELSKLGTIASELSAWTLPPTPDPADPNETTIPPTRPASWMRRMRGR